MEKLVDSGLLAGVIDVTTTEVADELVGGVLSAGPDAPRRDRPHAACPMSARAARSTWSTSGRLDTVPERFADRKLHVHNPNVTLMRTTAEECRAHRRLHRRQAQRMRGPGALPDPRRRRVGDRRAGQAVLRSRRPTRRCSTRIDAELPRRHRPQARCACRSHQRPGVRRRAGRRLRRDRRDAARRRRATDSHARIARQTSSSGSAA